jgi:hypothetical protein
MKMTVFWDVGPCSLVEIDRRFRGSYCLHHYGDRTSEKFASFYETTLHIIEDSHLQGDLSGEFEDDCLGVAPCSLVEVCRRFRQLSSSLLINRVGVWTIKKGGILLG